METCRAATKGCAYKINSKVVIHNVNEWDALLVGRHGIAYKYKATAFTVGTVNSIVTRSSILA